MTVCQGCGTDLPPNKGRGIARKWCSDRCRKQTLYGGRCVDCGTSTNGSDGPGKAPERCVTCANLLRQRWTPETIIAAIRVWADERGGIPPTATDWNATVAPEPRDVERFPSQHTVQEHFGSWSAAIRAAGFDAFASGHYGREGEDPAIVAETVRLYRSGLSLVQVGERMGVSGHAVLHRLRKVGEPRRPAHRHHRERVAA